MGEVFGGNSEMFCLYTVELQWLDHLWLVCHCCFELVLVSLRKNPIAADLE